MDCGGGTGKERGNGFVHHVFWFVWFLFNYYNSSAFDRLNVSQINTNLIDYSQKEGLRMQLISQETTAA